MRKGHEHCLTNEQRADRGRRVLWSSHVRKAYGKEPDATVATDIIADLLHALGPDVVRVAQGHYETERDAEARGRCSTCEC